MSSDTRYSISWVDLSDDSHLEEIIGKDQQGVIDALQHWFREGAPSGWCAFQVCADATPSKEQG